MNNKRIIRILSKLAVLALFALYATNAFAIDPKSRVVSPFWQHAGNTYTFVAITHPSLSGMNSDIGVTATAFLGDGGEGSTSIYGTSKSFTVSAGQTAKLFIFGTNLQGTNAVFNEANFPNDTVILGSTTAGGTGYLRFDPVATNPESIPAGGNGFPDITMLSFWGAVVFTGSNTGFAMEFIGDLNDSSSHPGQSAGTFASGVN